MQVWYMRTIRAAYHADFLCPPLFWLFCPLASQYCLHQLSGASHVIYLPRFNRRFVPCCCFALWLHYTPAAENVNSSIAQKSAADFMQIDETDILIYIVYNSWTTIMPLWGRRSPVAPFLCSNVKSYGKEKYSIIRFLYGFNIHCFNGKELWYALKKLEYTRIVLIIV